VSVCVCVCLVVAVRVCSGQAPVNAGAGGFGRAPWKNWIAARHAESARPGLTSHGSWRERLAWRALNVMRRALLGS
jgi:hypothetical protein